MKDFVKIVVWKFLEKLINTENPTILLILSYNFINYLFSDYKFYLSYIALAIFLGLDGWMTHAYPRQVARTRRVLEYVMSQIVVVLTVVVVAWFR